MASACSSDPFAGAPALPAAAERVEWWAARVRGKTVGIEERAFGEGEIVARRASFSFASAGERSDVYKASLVRCDPSGCGVTEGGQERWYEGAVAPELWPPRAERRGPVLDAGGLAEDALVSFDGDRLSWSGRAGQTTVWLDRDGRPERARFGAVEWQREEGPLTRPEPVDVGLLLSVPVTRVKDARKTLIGEYLVDGKPLRIDVPSWLELPPEREAIRALVYEVAAAVQDRFAPGRAPEGQGGVLFAQGDCTEHATALVEAARARGYRAETAVGYVYVETGGPRLAPHAWAKIEIGGRLVAADAALRQFPADATHIEIGSTIEDLSRREPSIEIRSIR